MPVPNPLVHPIATHEYLYQEDIGDQDPVANPIGTSIEDVHALVKTNL